MDDVCRRAATDAAKKEIARYKPFDDPVFMDLLELVVRKLEVNALEIDREFIHELDALYLFLDEQLDIRKLQKRLTCIRRRPAAAGAEQNGRCAV